MHPPGAPAHGRRALSLWMLAGLVGCAGLPKPPPDQGLLTGRLVIRVEASAGAAAQTHSAGFELSGHAAQGRLKLLSPLGTAIAEARWAGGRAELDQGDAVRPFESLDALTEAALGEALPLAALFDWLTGQPWPGAPSQTTEPGFAQLGWLIDVSALATDGLLQAQRQASPVVALKIRLDR
ncbi:MAG: lipoprotein insertase outer membrane protein LolB [Ideonella sp.]